MLHLVHRALLRGLVRTVTMDLCSVPESAAGEMIIGDFDHNLRIDRLPFAGSFRAPAARPAGSIPSESRFLPERLELFREGRAFGRLKSGRKPDVMEQAIIVV